MPSTETRQSDLLQQQTILARFGELALRSDDLDEVLTEACRLVCEALGTELAKVMELEEDGETLLVRAGVGWRPGIVGELRVRAAKGSSEGYALATGEPVVSNDIVHEDRFEYSDFIKEHGVRALVNVIIIGSRGKPPFGILQVDGRAPRDFGDGEIDFLRSYANLLAATVERLRASEATRRASDENREIASRLQAVIDGIPQLVWQADAAGRFRWVSPQWRAYTGLSEAQSLGEGWLEAVDPGDRDTTRQAWREAQASGRFAVEHRLVHRREARPRWFQTRATAVRRPDGAIAEWLGTATDIDDLRQMQEEQRVLVAELQHRTRNLITVVGAIAQQTMRQTGPSDAFQVAFADRLTALSRVQSLLSRAPEERVTIGDIVQMELEALGSQAAAGRVAVEGPRVPLRKSVVQTMALAIHELATNARKYGALANGAGRLLVRWGTARAEGGADRLRFEWTETGIDPERAGRDATTAAGGYGRQLIEKALPYSLEARTSFELDASGLRCTIDLPLNRPSRGARA